MINSDSLLKAQNMFVIVFVVTFVLIVIGFRILDVSFFISIFLSLITTFIVLVAVRVYRASKRKQKLSLLLKEVSIVTDRSEVNVLGNEDWANGSLKFQGVNDFCLVKVQGSQISVKLPSTLVSKTILINLNNIDKVVTEISERNDVIGASIYLLNLKNMPFSIPWRKEFSLLLQEKVKII